VIAILERAPPLVTAEEMIDAKQKIERTPEEMARAVVVVPVLAVAVRAVLMKIETQRGGEKERIRRIPLL
jgi:hypothetical protein